MSHGIYNFFSFIGFIILVSVLQSAHAKRFSVSCILDFFYIDKKSLLTKICKFSKVMTKSEMNYFSTFIWDKFWLVMFEINRHIRIKTVFSAIIIFLYSLTFGIVLNVPSSLKDYSLYQSFRYASYNIEEEEKIQMSDF